MRKESAKRRISLFLALALLLGWMPNFAVTTYADTQESITESLEETDQKTQISEDSSIDGMEGQNGEEVDEDAKKNVEDGDAFANSADEADTSQSENIDDSESEQDNGEHDGADVAPQPAQVEAENEAAAFGLPENGADVAPQPAQVEAENEAATFGLPEIGENGYLSNIQIKIGDTSVPNFNFSDTQRMYNITLTDAQNEYGQGFSVFLEYANNFDPDNDDNFNVVKYHNGEEIIGMKDTEFSYTRWNKVLSNKYVPLGKTTEFSFEIGDLDDSYEFERSDTYYFNITKIPSLKTLTVTDDSGNVILTPSTGLDYENTFVTEFSGATQSKTVKINAVPINSAVKIYVGDQGQEYDSTESIDLAQYTSGDKATIPLKLVYDVEGNRAENNITITLDVPKQEEKPDESQKGNNENGYLSNIQIKIGNTSVPGYQFDANKTEYNITLTDAQNEYGQGFSVFLEYANNFDPDNDDNFNVVKYHNGEEIIGMKDTEFSYTRWNKVLSNKYVPLGKTTEFSFEIGDLDDSYEFERSDTYYFNITKIPSLKTLTVTDDSGNVILTPSTGLDYENTFVTEFSGATQSKTVRINAIPINTVK